MARTSQASDKEGNKGRSGGDPSSERETCSSRRIYPSIHQVSRNIERTGLHPTSKELLRKQSKNIAIVKWTIDKQDFVTISHGG